MRSYALLLACLFGHPMVPCIAAEGTKPAVIVSTVAGRSLLGNVDGTGPGVGFGGSRGVAIDHAGNVYVADSFNHTIRKVSPGGVVTTFAGKAGVAGSVDGPAAQARFRSPFGVVVDPFGTIFVADGVNHTIRAISPAGDVRTVAGQAGVRGDTDGVGAAARFNLPSGLAVDAAGTLYVADSDNGTIRAISPTGDVRTVAGQAGRFGDADGPGSLARFTTPVSVATDNAGALFVSDISTATIRAIDPAGNVTTLAGKTGVAGSADGTGADARFNFPLGLAVDRLGNVYVADGFNGTIRRISPLGVVSTLAGAAGVYGDADGPARDARFSQPAAVAVADDDILYVTDIGAGTLRTIDAAGIVNTLAGESSRGDRDGVASVARFSFPLGLAVDRQGNLYVADTANDTIRHISPTGEVRTLAGRAGEPGHIDGPGADARFSFPNGVAVDRAGNVYVADEGNFAVRKIAPDGTTSTIANITAGFVDITSVAVDAWGNVYVADSGDQTISKINPAGKLTLFAGSARQRGSVDGIGAAAHFDGPRSVAVDDAGFVYVAERGGTIRKISPTGEVTTLAGQAGSRAIVDGVGRDARFLDPEGLTVDGLGNVFVIDGGATIRQITPAGKVTTIAGQPGLFGGGNGPGDEARFSIPGAIAVDRFARLYIADSGNNVIRKAISTTQLVNLSVRGRVGTGDQTSIMGFVIADGGAKPLLVRSIGPTLGALGVNGANADPRLTLFDRGANPMGSNDDWGGGAQLGQVFDSVGAFPLDPGSKDAALFTTLAPGLYSVHTTATGNAGGVALTEAYDSGASATSRLVNLSARLYAGVGDDTVIAGFVLSGTAPKTFLIRAAGPSLVRLGLGASGVLVDPKLTLFQGATRIAENDDWGGTPEFKAVFQATGAFALDSDASKDAALVATLQPGIYTAHVTGANAGKGIALIEIYEVP